MSHSSSSKTMSGSSSSDWGSDEGSLAGSNERTRLHQPSQPRHDSHRGNVRSIYTGGQAVSVVTDATGPPGVHLEQDISPVAQRQLRGDSRISFESSRTLPETHLPTPPTVKTSATVHTPQHPSGVRVALAEGGCREAQKSLAEAQTRLVECKKKLENAQQQLQSTQLDYLDCESALRTAREEIDTKNTEIVAKDREIAALNARIADLTHENTQQQQRSCCVVASLGGRYHANRRSAKAVANRLLWTEKVPPN